MSEIHEQGENHLTLKELQRIKTELQLNVMAKMGYKVNSEDIEKGNAEGQRWADDHMSERFRRFFEKHQAILTHDSKKEELAQLIKDEMSRELFEETEAAAGEVM